MDYGKVALGLIIQTNSFVSVSDETNIFTCDLSVSKNFTVTVSNTTAKTLVFSNIPQTSNNLLAINVEIISTNVASFTYPSGTTWNDNAQPIFVTGKSYELLFISRDGGISWKASFVGAW